MNDITIEMSDKEADAVLRTLNRAYDDIPHAETKRWVDKAATRLEKALRKGRGVAS